MYEITAVMNFNFQTPDQDSRKELTGSGEKRSQRDSTSTAIATCLPLTTPNSTTLIGLKDNLEQTNTVPSNVLNESQRESSSAQTHEKMFGCSAAMWTRPHEPF